jgi:hypothetical protein
LVAAGFVQCFGIVFVVTKMLVTKEVKNEINPPKI